MRILNSSVYLVSLLMIGCVAHKTTTTTTPTVHSTKYSEDLSVVRPRVEPIAVDTTVLQPPNERKQTTAYIEPKHAINQQLDTILDSISRINLTQKYIEGFTIQVYSGSKREEALNIKRQLNNSLPDAESEVQYMQPNFRVRVGKYLQRLDAQKDYMAVKRHFPNAIVIPDKIAIN